MKGNDMLSYEQALKIYEGAYNPPRSKKWKAMPDNARPLDGTSYFHYGIHKREDGVVYYRLYDTNIATFYPPDAEGYTKVEMNYYNSMTTNTFIYKYGLHYFSLHTTDNKEVKIPYVPQYYAKKQGHSHSAVLYFKNNLLDVSKSHHADIYTSTSSAEDKQKRKDFKKKVDVLVTLAMLRLEDYKYNTTFDDDYGAPFGTAWRTPSSFNDFTHVINTVGKDETEDPRYIEAFLNMGQDVFNILANRRIYAYIPEGGKWQGELYRTYGLSSEQIQANKKIMEDIANKVTAEDFRKSLTNKLLDMVGIKEGTVKTAWGQFQPSVPRTYYF
jgi:hypothetical protein